MNQSNCPAPDTDASPASDDPSRDDMLSTMIVGNSAAAIELRRTICRMAQHDAPVLLTGPTGSGKDVAARALHRIGGRRRHPFVAANCAAIPAELIESELFGHERGAFTGATDRRIGLFEQAGKGMLFLDEIGDMPVAAQMRLLRVLEDRSFRRIGGAVSIPFAGQVICATHRNLPAAIAAGQFRRDLWYRIAVLVVRVPSLAERSDDIALLASHIARSQGVDIQFSADALALLSCHDWPGNIREFRNLVARAATLYSGTPVPANAIAGLLHPTDSWPDTDHGIEDQTGLDNILRAVELHQMRHALATHGGVVAQAARALGINRTTLVEKMRRHGLSRWPEAVAALPPH